MAERTGNPNALSLLWMRVLGTVAAVRPEERRDTLGAFLTLFGFMAGHALLETARDALFLASLPASLLPWVYLTIAVIALALTQNQPRFLNRFSTRHELSAWLVFSAVITFVFWLLVRLADRWVFYALYTWSGILATLVVVRFWTVLGNLFTVTQAKRLFVLIGSGSVLGAIVGSGLARALTEGLAAQHVVVAAAVVFLLASLGPRLLGGGERSTSLDVTTTAEIALPSPRSDLAEMGAAIWERPYLRRVGVLILVSTVTFTLVDYIFKSTVARSVPDQELGEFFSSVYFSLNILSLAVQVLVVGWLFRRVSVNLAQAIVPALLLAGSVGFVAAGGLGLALVLKGIDGSFRYSLYRTGTELLFLPLPGDLRGRVKAVIDVLGQRGGQALASLLILTALTITTREIVFGVVACGTAALWLVLALNLKKHYLDVFRDTLRDEITETRIAFPALDMSSLETLLSSLNSPDDRQVIAALDLLAGQGKVRVIPALILYHPSPPVVVHALDLFLRYGREDFLPIVDRLHGHPDARVRAASLRVESVARPSEARLRRARSDPLPEVAATALVGLVAGGWLPADQARASLQEIVQRGTLDARLALAQAIRYQPAPVFEQALLDLAVVDEPLLQVEAVRAMREVKSPLFVPALIDLLAQRAVRDEARVTLVALGPVTLARLGAALKDHSVPHGVRRHLPNTIGAFGSPQAADVLLRHLPTETDGMIRFKILRALGRLRTEHPKLPLDERTLHQAINQNLSAAFQLMRWRRALEAGARGTPGRNTTGHEILITLLRDKQNHALERLFRLLNLQANNEDFVRIYRGLFSRKRESQAGSRELIENLVMPPVREPLLTLIDDLYEPLGGFAAGNGEEDASPTYEEVLRELLESNTESLSCVAAHHIGELRLRTLGPALEHRIALSADHAVVLEHARLAVTAPTAQRSGHA